MRQDWSPLAEGRTRKTYPAGQMIYLQGTEADTFYYLIEGTARSFISSAEGTERLLTLHHSGDLMGEASFFDQCPRVSSAVAVTDCQVVSIDSVQLNRIFKARPELAFPMLRYLARTVRMLSGHVDDISFRPADQRLASVLLDWAEANGTIRCTHEDLGSAVGVSRVTVSRVLSGFADRGWLETGYRSLRLLDLAALEAFARSDL